jgi:arginase
MVEPVTDVESPRSRGSFGYIGVIEDSVGRNGAGAELAATRLRDLGILHALDAADRGDLDVPIRGNERDPRTGIVASDDVLEMTRAVRAEAEAAIRAGDRPFVVGGCCASAVGALAGARDALGRLHLVYVDGHQDMYDGRTSTTGEAADMPFATALGIGPVEWVEAAGGASIGPPDSWLVGFSDHEEALAAGALQPSDILAPSHLIDAGALRRQGAPDTGRAIRDSLDGEAPRFWLHLDVDVLDGSIFPATDYPAEAGLTLEELTALLRPLATSPSLAGISIGCYNPDKDTDEACGRAFVEMWRSVLAA